MTKSTTALWSVVIGGISLFCLHTASVEACTGIRLQSVGGGTVYGRTMEWGAFDLNTRVAIIPRGYEFSGLTPEGLNGKKWTAKYGVVGLDMLHKDWLADGMNEKGLTVGLFYHPGFAVYSKYEKSKASNSITAVDVVSYILSQFATIDEVRRGMDDVLVVAVLEEAIGNIPVQAHWFVTSPDGDSVVIEFTDGKMKIYDNPLGVLTNSPNFDWHMTNLRNYVNLSQVSLPGKRIEELDFKPLGGGSGMIGLPGDFTPPSRFVRAVAYTQTARLTSSANETVYEVFRILDNFNLPLGAAEGAGDVATQGMRSATIWTSVWNLQDCILSYHTQHNRRVRTLDLKKIDFSNIGEKIIHLSLDKNKEQDTEELTLSK